LSAIRIRMSTLCANAIGKCFGKAGRTIRGVDADAAIGMRRPIK
jgi:hypothetical protein